MLNAYLGSKEYLTGSEPEVQIDLSWTDSGFVSYNRFISRKTKLFILCSDREHLYIFLLENVPFEIRTDDISDIQYDH